MSVRSVEVEEEEWQLSDVARTSAQEGLAHAIRSLAELKGFKITELTALGKAHKVEEKVRPDTTHRAAPSRAHQPRN